LNLIASTFCVGVAYFGPFCIVCNSIFAEKLPHHSRFSSFDKLFQLRIYATQRIHRYIRPQKVELQQRLNYNSSLITRFLPQVP